MAESESKAKYSALKQVKDWIEPHRDDLYEAEHAFCLSDAAGDRPLYVHLTKATQHRDVTFTCEYIPIRKAT
ncbi:MAG: hypothetical protein PW788_08555 [Micavibrio sp.]|nr:hypothetical protein [Micavibrio sp.]